jgi:hypothetical protein
MPKSLNLCMILSTYSLWKSFHLESYMIRMISGLKNTNEWRKGGSIDVLKNKDMNSKEMKQFYKCLDRKKNGKEEEVEEVEEVNEDELSANAILQIIREVEDFFESKKLPSTSTGTACSTITSIYRMIQKYYKMYQNKWIDIIPNIFGYVQTKESE